MRGAERGGGGNELEDVHLARAVDAARRMRAQPTTHVQRVEAACEEVRNNNARSERVWSEWLE